LDIERAFLLSSAPNALAFLIDAGLSKRDTPPVAEAVFGRRVA
jgi:hypothetical protein